MLQHAQGSAGAQALEDSVCQPTAAAVHIAQAEQPGASKLLAAVAAQVAVPDTRPLVAAPVRFVNIASLPPPQPPAALQGSGHPSFSQSLLIHGSPAHPPQRLRPAQATLGREPRSLHSARGGGWHREILWAKLQRATSSEAGATKHGHRERSRLLDAALLGRILRQVDSLADWGLASQEPPPRGATAGCTGQAVERPISKEYVVATRGSGRRQAALGAPAAVQMGTIQLDGSMLAEPTECRSRPAARDDAALKTTRLAPSHPNVSFEGARGIASAGEQVAKHAACVDAKAPRDGEQLAPAMAANFWEGPSPFAKAMQQRQGIYGGALMSQRSMQRPRLPRSSFALPRSSAADKDSLLRTYTDLAGGREVNMKQRREVGKTGSDALKREISRVHQEIVAGVFTGAAGQHS
jgi:hypothetical protein